MEKLDKIDLRCKNTGNIPPLLDQCLMNCILILSLYAQKLSLLLLVTQNEYNKALVVRLITL